MGCTLGFIKVKHMNTYTLFFENSRGGRRELGVYKDFTDEKELLREVNKAIHDFCTDRDFQIHYTRLWNSDGETVFDVGSHTEFFYLNPQIQLF